MEYLPLEIQHHIIIHTNPTDLGRISCISKFYKTLCEDYKIWKEMYEMHFGGPYIYDEYRFALVKNVCELEGLCDSLSDKLEWATRKGHYNLLRKILLQNPDLVHIGMKDDRSILHLACTRNHYLAARVIIAFGVDINKADISGNTASHISSQLGFPQILSLLISKNTQVNCRDRKGRTPLHNAAYDGHTDCVKALLSASDIKIDLTESTYGQTALHIASGRGHSEIVKLLLRHHANVNAVDRDGWSALHNSCFKGQYYVVAMLLAHQARTDLLIANRWSARSFAENKGHHDIVDLFKSPQMVNSVS